MHDGRCRRCPGPRAMSHAGALREPRNFAGRDLFGAIYGTSTAIARVDGQTGESSLFTSLAQVLGETVGLGIGPGDELFAGCAEGPSTQR